MNVQAIPMVTMAIRMPIQHFQRLAELARERGHVTSKGRPIVSTVAREVLVEALTAGNEQEEITDEQT